MAQWTVAHKRNGDHSFLAALREACSGVAGVRETHLRVSGNSMLPGLPSGSAVVVRRSQRDIAPGVLIAYRRRGDLIVHRVVAVQQGSTGRIFCTKGDNNLRCDAPVPASEVLGRVVAVEPSGGGLGQEHAPKADRTATGGLGLLRRLGLR